MNAQPEVKIKKENKRTIKADFDRTPFWTRMKAKYFTLYFLQRLVWGIFRYVLLIGISYVILYPFFAKISSSFMGTEDFVDATVKLIPKNFTLDTYKYIILENKYFQAVGNTTLLSLLAAVLQTMVCALIGYGFAKFKFKGKNLLFILVIISMVIPHQTLSLSLFMKFRYFDVLGINQFLGGGVFPWLNIHNLMPWLKSFLSCEWWPWLNKALGLSSIFASDTSLNFINSFMPLMLLSVTGLAFKNGLYIFMMRQFYRGVPDELEESAYVDGAGVFYTFNHIILPLSVPMMITVFLLSFSWQWTDSFYTTLFFTKSTITLMKDIISVPPSLKIDYAGSSLYNAAIRNTCGLLIIAPLIILYLFCQRYLIQGIERSGLTAD